MGGARRRPPPAARSCASTPTRWATPAGRWSTTTTPSSTSTASKGGSSGSGWSTASPWESCRARPVARRGGTGATSTTSPTTRNFVCDGLVSASREPHPLLEEVRWLGRPVRCVELEHRRSGAASTVLRNQRWFTDTSDLETRWELSADGEVTAEGVLGGVPLRPRELRTAGVSWPAAALRPGAEHLLTLCWRQRTRTSWAPKGTVVGWEQRSLPVADEAARRRRSRRPALPTPSNRPRSAPPLPEGFPGELTPTLFRALTDNDGIRSGFDARLQRLPRALGGRPRPRRLQLGRSWRHAAARAPRHLR